MRTASIFALAALLEILACYAVWAIVRSGASLLWLGPAAAGLFGFAWLLTQADVSHAGRAFAAYGAIYIAASLVWLQFAEGVRPDRFDLIGVALCLGGAATIAFAPRGLA